MNIYINLEITEICRHILLLTGRHNLYTDYTMEEKTEVLEMQSDIIKELDWNGVGFTKDTFDTVLGWQEIILQLWNARNLRIAIQSIIAVAYRYALASVIDENMEEILNIIRMDSKLTSKEI